jgi:hypothetical protein
MIKARQKKATKTRKREVFGNVVILKDKPAEQARPSSRSSARGSFEELHA